MMWNSEQINSAQKMHQLLMSCGRQTGRTTRMVKVAVRLAEEGKTVLVLGANWQHLNYIQKMLQDLHVGREVEDRIVFSTVSEMLFRGGAEMLRGRKIAFPSEDTIVLSDHHAQEDIVSTLLSSLLESRKQVEHYHRQQERTKMLVGELMGIWGL